MALGCGGGLAQTDREQRFFEERVKADPQDFLAWNRLGDVYLLRERRSGDMAWLARADEAAGASLRAVASEFNPAGLSLRARVDMAQHRFAAARDHAKELLAVQPGGALATLGDALLELGELDEAAEFFARLAEAQNGSVAAESRLARLAWLRGQHEEARAHFGAALKAAQAAIPPVPLTEAWCGVQLGELAFRTGRWDDAEAAYHAAAEALPDWWSTVEHLAEFEGARGHDAEAVALYEQAIKNAPRPELWQALGDFHAFMKRPDAAKPCQEKALAGYRASLDRGEVLYVHHLAGFYADSQENATEAVIYARRDLELRHGGYAQDALAWALYRQSDFPAALDAAKQALATGLADPHVLYHAAMIHLSAGDIAAGQGLLKRCAEVNPHFNAFHVHR